MHAWDHYKWQVEALRMSTATLADEIQQGVGAFREVLERSPDCTAAAGWICNETLLAAEEGFAFRYNSDCRGRASFMPVVDGERLTPQVPTTLPTYDEAIGRNGVTDENYNAELFRLILPDQLNVLTIHAEVEGMSRAALFESFLDRCAERGIGIEPLSAILSPRALPADEICLAPIAGRDGDLCWQRSAAPC